MKIIVGLLLTLITLFSACSKYSDGPKISLSSKEKRLLGEWKIISVDGTSIDKEVILEFDSDGDHRLFDDEYYNVGYPTKNHTGTWTWEDDKANIYLEYDLHPTSHEIQIKRLTQQEFWFDDLNNNLVKCNKQ